MPKFCSAICQQEARCAFYQVGILWGINQQVGESTSRLASLLIFAENVGDPQSIGINGLITYGPFCRIPKHQAAEVRSSCVLDFEG